MVLSYAVQHALQAGASGYRLVNLLADAAASAMLAGCVLAAGSSGAAALLAGLAFATLPAHLESVVWISGRTDLFAAVFGLASLLLFVRWRRTRRPADEGLALLALAAALLSKENAAPLFGVFAVAAWVEPGAGGFALRRWLRDWVPAALLTGVYLVVHFRLAPGEALPAALVETMRARSAGGFWLLLPGYLSFLWPWYPHSPAATLDLTTPPGFAEIAGGAVLLAASVVGVAFAIARRSRAAVAWSLAGATLLPVLAVNAARGTLLFAERFFYFPSAGVIAALALHGSGLPATARRAASIVAIVLIGAGCWQSLERMPDWRNDETLFRSMTRLQPRNVTGYLQLGRELDRQGRSAEAARAADEAARLDPQRADVLAVQGLIALRAGDPATALERSNRAIAGGSLQLESRLVRAASLAALGRLPEAGGAIDSLRASMPGNPEVESLWGQYLLASGRAAEARPILERAVRRFPDDADIAFALGMACADTGAGAEAITAFERSVAKRPGYYEAWLQLGAARLQSGDRAGAARAFESAMRLPQASDGRAAALRRMTGEVR